MLDLSTAQTFKLIQTSRRSELLAWALFVFMIPVVIVNPAEGLLAGPGTVLLLVFFGLSAAVMSFGNWVDRRTILQLDRDKIRFENGLRKVSLRWDKLERLEIHQDKIGKKVLVFGENAYFKFRTMGEVVISEKVRGQVGFERGNAILETILGQADLVENPNEQASGVTWKKPENLPVSYKEE